MSLLQVHVWEREKKKFRLAEGKINFKKWCKGRKIIFEDNLYTINVHQMHIKTRPRSPSNIQHPADEYTHFSAEGQKLLACYFDLQRHNSFATKLSH